MIKFTKMQGIGNDYVYINNMDDSLKNISELSKYVSNRHFGIGSDGLILIEKSSIADFKMRIINADGSEAEMCGNGIRCVGKYVYDKHLTTSSTVTVEKMMEVGLIKDARDGVKILGNGELTKKLNVKANAFSATAKEKIEALGGTVEVI